MTQLNYASILESFHFHSTLSWSISWIGDARSRPALTSVRNGCSSSFRLVNRAGNSEQRQYAQANQSTTTSIRSDSHSTHLDDKDTQEFRLTPHDAPATLVPTPQNNPWTHTTPFLTYDSILLPLPSFLSFYLQRPSSSHQPDLTPFSSPFENSIPGRQNSSSTSQTRRLQPHIELGRLQHPIASETSSIVETSLDIMYL